MNVSTFVTSLDDIMRCAEIPQLHEVLLEPAILAREGRLSKEQVYELADAARTQGLRPVLVWDILLPERVWGELSSVLEAWDWSLFDAVRVNDIGAAQWLMTFHPKLPLQLNVETGNHNKGALLGWCEIFSPSLERLILSIELPEDKLMEYCRELPVPCELLGAGRILLFYSPRSLLAQHLSPEGSGASKGEAPRWEAVSASENSNFKPMPVVETMHGTFLFLDKDQFILDRLSSLLKAGLFMVRLDLRHLSHGSDSAQNVDTIVECTLSNPAMLRKEWPRPTRAPFFRTNNTTGQFSRMKASHHAYRDVHTLAEILFSEKRQYMVVVALRPFKTSEVRAMMLPSGEEFLLPEPLVFQTLDGAPCESAATEQILVVAWTKKACSGAFLRSENLG